MSVKRETSLKDGNNFKNVFVRSSDNRGEKIVHERFRKQAESQASKSV